jgi:hypothetical protein
MFRTTVPLPDKTKGITSIQYNIGTYVTSLKSIACRFSEISAGLPSARLLLFVYQRDKKVPPGIYFLYFEVVDYSWVARRELIK